MKTKLLTTCCIAGLAAATLMSGVAEAKEKGDWMIRARGIWVSPDAGGTTSIGGDVDIDDKVVPEVDFTYFVTDNIALELIAATTKHNPVVKGSDLGDVPIGSVWLLPPTVTVQYHFAPQEDFSPYVGAGVNYTFFYSENTSDTLDGLGLTTIDYSDGFGWALQAGVDYKIKDQWYFNIDVKKLFLSTDVSIANGAVTAPDVDIDPWIVGVGIGYLF
ncbi:OmpW/AlkL family protein [Emcibacter nanhaiensis]|uniref:OmpW family protein n=1 Tax=Emcibacter nanhaiensis TaxID=1505037 RepID=A0A501PQP8_9PROT|nr:OmpW family protein [Emcibacter nanhaiensis]TPD62793.1 OmpW family protein [Emcibacter nanhaiensis]